MIADMRQKAGPSELRLPVSAKGVVIQDGKALLFENERQEWELPGGKLDPGEDLIPCVERELLEEAGWVVKADRLLNVWLYTIYEDRVVLIVTYGCTTSETKPAVLSNEHRQLGLFTSDEIEALNMPEGYKEAVRMWFDAVAAAN